MDPIEQQAADILDVGERRLRTDNYEERMDYFAQELNGLPAEQQAQLFTEILEQDSGAEMSWLEVSRLNNMVAEGSITEQERSAVFDAFGQAYVDGEIKLGDALGFTDIYGSPAVGPLGVMPDAEAMDTLLTTLNDSNGPAGSEFIERFATDVLTERVFAEHSGSTPAEQAAYAGVLLNALDQAGGTDAVNTVLGELSSEQRKALLDGVTAEGLSMSSDYATLADANVRDPMAIYTDTIANHGTPEQVIDLVRHVNANSQGNGFDNTFYGGGNKPYGERAEALSQLFLQRSDTILNRLTVADPSQTAGSTNDRSTVVGENLAALSNLMRLTGLNSDNPYQARVMDRIGEFTSENIRLGNQPEGADVNGDGLLDGDDTAAIDKGNGRAAMMGAVMQDAVSSGYVDLRADIAARDAFVGFILDAGISAIPVAGDFAARQITRHVDGALGGLEKATRDEIANSLAAIPEDVLTDAQGRLSSQAKQAIIDALPEDYAALEDIKSDSNTFIEDAILSGSDRDYRLTESMSDYRSYIDQAKNS